MVEVLLPELTAAVLVVEDGREIGTVDAEVDGERAVISVVGMYNDP